MKEDNNSMHRTRHLILIIMSVLVMTMMGLTCHAENSQGQRPPFDPKRFEAELEQYITIHASLTPQEASKFFPVYRQMMKKMRSCFDEMRKSHEGYRVVGDLHVTDHIMENSFWIGVYPGMTDAKLDYMAKVLCESVRG